MKVTPLIPIGTIIQVDKSKIENIIQNKSLNDLPQVINGRIVDYKMTDGMGIGYVLITDNNLKIWIFNTELNDKIRREYKIEETNKSKKQENNDLILGKYKVAFDINGNREIKTIVNPINLINWLIFTMKDIF